MSQLWEAAGVGHRITHEDDLPEPEELIVVTEALRDGAASGGASHGAALAADFARRFGAGLRGLFERIDFEAQGVGDCPDPCGCIERGSEDTFIGRDLRGVAIARDDVKVECNHDADGPLVEGAVHVYVNGVPWARRRDALDCGARVGEGEPSILIGGEPTPTHQRRVEDVLRPTALGPALSRRVRTDPVDAVEMGRQLAGVRGGRQKHRPFAGGPNIGRSLDNLGAVSALLSR